MKKQTCSQCGTSSSGPYRRLWEFDNKLLCRSCAVKTYGYEEHLTD